MPVYNPQTVPTFKELDFTQAGAVQNTWYTAFQGYNVKFYGLACGITVADETVEVRVTIDGNVITSAAGIALAFAGNAWSSVTGAGVRIAPAFQITLSAAAATLSSCLNSADQPVWLVGRSVKIEVRKTSAGGASALRIMGVYGQW